MDKRNYFKDLISLYEAVGMAGTEEVTPQENIADTGADVNGMGAEQQPMMDDSENQMMAPEQNPGAIDSMTGMPIPQEPVDPTEILEKEKLKRLYELFEDLLQYGDVFVESIRYVNIGLLDLEIYKKTMLYINDAESLLEKIKNYLINIFNKEKYEKNLYTYILFRTELITIIKGLRDILKLDKPDEKFE